MITRGPVAVILCLLLACGLPAAAPAAGPQFPQMPPVMAPEDTARLRVYYEAIGPVVRPFAARASLADLIRPLLQLAGTRAAASPADHAAAAENRAALIALAFYVNGKDPARLFPEAAAWQRPGWRRILLAGRGDLAQHFTISAAVSAAAGAPIAHVIGMYKELDDARRGGGFSFSDLTADRAGTVFGGLAVASTDSARRLQTRMADALLDADIMPPVDGLPPDLSEREFTQRYRGDHDAAFRTVLGEIDRRIGGLRIYRP